MYIGIGGNRFTLRKDRFSGIKRAFRDFNQAYAFSFIKTREGIIQHLKRK